MGKTAAFAKLWPVLGVVLALAPLLAQADTGLHDRPWLVSTLLGGSALLFYGLDKLGAALKILAGGWMRALLGQLADSRLRGLWSGAIFAAILPSTPAVVSMLAGFVSAGLLSFPESISLMLGAGVGATFIVQVVAFELAAYAPWLLLIGVALIAVWPHGVARQSGELLLGAGLLFLGLGLLRDTLLISQHDLPFISWLATPWIALALPALLSLLTRAPTAVVCLALTLAMVGSFALENSLLLVLGAMSGAALIPLMQGMGQGREALRVKMAAALLTLLAVLVAVWLLPQLADLARLLAPSGSEAALAGVLGGTVPRQTAHGYTLIALLLVVVALPLSPVLIRLCETLIPEHPESDEPATPGAYQPKYLNGALLDTPALALEMARRETSLLALALEQLVADHLDAILLGDGQQLARLRRLDDEVGEIAEAVNHYLAQMGGLNVSLPLSEEILAINNALYELEAIASHVGTGLARVELLWQQGVPKVSPAMVEALNRYHKGVVQALKSATTAFITDNQQAAKLVLSMSEELRGQALACLNHNSPANSQHSALLLQTTVQETLNNCYDHARRLAKGVIRQAEL